MKSQFCIDCGLPLDANGRCPKCNKTYSLEFPGYNSYDDQNLNSYSGLSRQSGLENTPLEQSRSDDYSSKQSGLDNNSTQQSDSENSQNMETLDQDAWNRWMSQNIRKNSNRQGTRQFTNQEHQEQGDDLEFDKKHTDEHISPYTIAAIILSCLIVIQLIILVIIHNNNKKLSLLPSKYIYLCSCETMEPDGRYVADNYLETEGS